MKIKDLLSQATQFLKTSSPSARLDAEVLLSFSLDCRREDLYIHSEKTIPPVLLGKCLQNIERRISGEPVSYITNSKEFLGYNFFVKKGVLIPRPETELLVEYALHWIETLPPKKYIWGLDLGTGSGCIALSLLKEVSNLNIAALDISEVAKEVSAKNAKDLGVEQRFHFYLKNADVLDFTFFDSLKESDFINTFDFIVSNPPYISKVDPLVEENVLKNEPHEALFCDENGLEKIKKWTNVAGGLLNSGGLWIFEIGAAQGPISLKIVKESGFFEKVELAQDYSGRDRFVIAFKKQTITNS